MTLAAVAARRLVLRRGVSALAGLFVATAPRPDKLILPNQFQSAHSDSSIRPPASDDNHKRRRDLSAPLHVHREKAYRARHLSHEAWYCQDPDLVVLGSTSQAWRASVMRDRLKKNISIIDEFDRRINAIWSEPLDRLGEIMRGWVGDIL